MAGTTRTLTLPALWPDKRASQYATPSQWPTKADARRRLEAEEMRPRKPVQWLSVGPAAATADDGWDLGSTGVWPSQSSTSIVPLASRQKSDVDSADRVRKGTAALLEHLRAPTVPRALSDLGLSRMMEVTKRLNWAPIITGFAPRSSGILGRIEALRQKALQMSEELRQSRAQLGGMRASYAKSLQEVRRPLVPLLPIEDQVDDRFAPDTSLRLPSVTAPAGPRRQGSRYVHKRIQALAQPVHTVDVEWSLTATTSHLGACA